MRRWTTLHKGEVATVCIARRSVVARGKRVTALWIRAWRPASMLRLQCRWVMLPTTEGGRGASSHCHVLAWGASHATMGV